MLVIIPNCHEIRPPSTAGDLMIKVHNGFADEKMMLILHLWMVAWTGLECSVCASLSYLVVDVMGLVDTKRKP